MSTHEKYRFVIKKHWATRLHFDLRLECDSGVLSWALPVGPSLCSRDRREAIEMPDHQREYLTFEGVHATGTIMLWDQGAWVPHPACRDVNASLRNGVLRFTIEGERLGGDWKLERQEHANGSSTKIVWILSKEQDEFAVEPSEKPVTEKFLKGVSSNRTKAEIEEDWQRSRKNRRMGQLAFGF